MLLTSSKHVKGITTPEIGRLHREVSALTAENNGVEEDQRTYTRREVLKGLACGGLALTGAAAVLPACAPLLSEIDERRTEEREADQEDPSELGPPTYRLPTEDGAWAPPVSHVARLPSGGPVIHIDGLGTFGFHAHQVETVRPDIFQPGHFSLFDILVHLSEMGDIDHDYHFDEAMDTHVIDAVDGERGWWYNAHYSAGWFEASVTPMDLYPYKDGTVVRLDRIGEDRLAPIYQSYRDEVQRLAANGGEVVIPELTIRAPSGRIEFQDVVVTAYDVRNDVLQPGVVTALDAIISLAEQGQIANLELTWYDRIARADPVDSYWVERINDDVASGGCGYVYECGSREFAGFAGAHNHIPADVQVSRSPEYALWFWICLGRAGL